MIEGRWTIWMFLLIAGLTSCEKVIDIPLNEVGTQTVIEGVLNDGMGNNYILLSKTSSVYAQGNFPKISNATVTVRDDNNNIYVFDEVDTAAGRYNCPTLKVEPETNYYLDVLTNGEQFTSHSYAHKTPKLDSISTVKQEI